MASDDPLLAMVGRPGGPLADAALWQMAVRSVDEIADGYRRITFGGPSLGQLRHRPGQDLMLRIPVSGEAAVNRRYTIRRADPGNETVTLDMVVHGDGPGARWVANAAVGDLLDAIGPRGKIVANEEAAWHLFVGDETALPGMAAMAESLRPGVRATLIVEVPSHARGQDPESSAGQDIQVRWIERGDGEPGQPHRLVAAVEQVDLPSGLGQAYLAGEMKVVRAVVSELASRGLDGPRVSAKAYWRLGGPNASHGEPLDPNQARAARQ